jgi:hypothetical protein
MTEAIMAGAGLRSHISRVWARCGAFLSETLAVSAEAGFYPDPLHLGHVLGLLYSSEGHSEHRNGDFGVTSDTEPPS